jgi:hypothetical protein
MRRIPARERSPGSDTQLARSRRRQIAKMPAHAQTTEADPSPAAARPAIGGTGQPAHFHRDETRLGMALHRLAAEERVGRAEAEMKFRIRQRKEAARHKLLTEGPPGTVWQTIKALIAEFLRLGSIAGFGFNGWNVTVQLAVAEAMRARLPAHLSTAEREAASVAVGAVVSSFASGFGALSATIFWAPLAEGIAHKLGGAWVIRKQDLELLFIDPDPYIDRDLEITKTRKEFEAEERMVLIARTQAESEQGSFGLASKKAFVLITGGFWLFHSARIAGAPMKQSPWVEGPLTGTWSIPAAGLGNLALAFMKWRSTAKIKVDPGGDGSMDGGATRDMKLHFVAELAPENANAGLVAAQFKRTWDGFADGRQGKELAVFVVVQWLKLSGAVLLANMLAPMIQTGAASLSEHTNDAGKVLTKIGATCLNYAWALFVLLVLFPAIASARVRPKPASEEEALLALQEDDVDAVLGRLLPDLGNVTEVGRPEEDSSSSHPRQ